MRQFRCGVFETNSSSTHSIVICTQDDYEKFKNNKTMFDSWKHELVPYSSLLLEEEPERYQKYKYLGIHGDWYTLDTFFKNFTTPSGDKMVAFGEYGRCG